MFKRRALCCLMIAAVLVSLCIPALALDASTLYNGSRGEAVRKLQQALIDQGYLSGGADGIFGKNTEKAVRSFQKAKGLEADGLAGKKTQSLLFSAQTSAASAPSASDASASSPAPAVPEGTGDSSVSAQTAPVSSGESSVSSDASAVAQASSGSLFAGNYATLSIGSSGSRVKVLQQALISLKLLSGRADGSFGKQTQKAVIAFQKKYGLVADGLAGRKTLKKLESLAGTGASAGSTTASSASSSSASPSEGPATSAVTTARMAAPDQSSIRLLHWFNDVKPSLSNGDHLLIYDPATGISWTLQVLSRGRHCDSEPLTREDTEAMVQAFGGVNTWNQKGVYVRLPSGVWTIGSTHDMPHMSGNIKGNGFDGHLCVHFLRDMAEAQQYDPNYGVDNQKTIRELWKKLTGEEITN